jgi:hypothetical protein
MKWKALLFFMLIPLLVAGCSTGYATSVAPQPTTLQVTRVSTLPDNHFPPLSRTITNTDDVKRLYEAALALPKGSTTGAHSCPADIGLIYHLNFLQNGKLLREMDLGPTGCPYILVSKTDMRPLTRSFESLFMQILGISFHQLIPEPTGSTHLKL